VKVDWILLEIDAITELYILHFYSSVLPKFTIKKGNPISYSAQAKYGGVEEVIVMVVRESCIWF
jgi:hypothetical protein